MSKQYFFKRVLDVLKDNGFLAVWEFLESEVFQNNWFAIAFIIYLGIVFEMVFIKICTSLQRKSALSEERTSDSEENEDSSSLRSMAFDNQSTCSSSEESTDVFSERTMISSLVCSPLISQRNEGPFEDRVPSPDETPLPPQYPHGSERKYHISNVSESLLSSTQRSNSSLSMIHSEIEKIFPSHQDHPEKEQEPVQFSSNKLFSIMKTKNPNTLVYSSNYRWTKTSTVSQESETPEVASCSFINLFLTRDQISLLEENVRNQISFKSKVTFKGKISFLLPKSQESLIQKQHSVQVDTLVQAQSSFPGQKTTKNQSFYEAKLTCQGQQFVYDQESISSQHDTEAKCLVLPQDVKRNLFCSSMQESTRAQDVDKSLHLTDTSCSIEFQDLIKTLESNKHLNEVQSYNCFQDLNKIKESTQNQATRYKNAKHLVSAVMPYLVAKETPRLKSIKKKDQPQIASSKLRQYSPYDSLPLLPTIKKQKRKALSSIALYLIYISRPVLPYIKKYSKRNLVKVALGLMVCKDFFLKQNKSPDVEKHSIEKRRVSCNTVNIKQLHRNKTRLKNISPKGSLKLEQSLMDNTQRSATCSANWNDQESFKDPLPQAIKIDITEFCAPSSKTTSGQHDLEYEIFFNGIISRLMQKLISSFKMESNRGLKTMKMLKSSENSHLPVSNGEKVPTSKPDIEMSFPKGNIQNDFMKTALKSIDINSFFTLGTQKQGNSEQLACVKSKESTEDKILKEKIPSILNITEYGNQNYGISDSEELECQPRSNIKNTQSDAFHSIPYAISEPPALEMENRLKAKTDTLRITGLSHLARRQKENPNEKKTNMEERYRFEMPQLLDKEEEAQETDLFCGGEEKVQAGEEGLQNSAVQHPSCLPLYLEESRQNTSDLELSSFAQGLLINDQDAPHLIQNFPLGLQVQQMTKCVQSEAQQSGVGKRKNQEKEPEVKLQTPQTQITWGTCPCPTKGSSQDGNVKQCIETPRKRKSTDPKNPVAMLENIPIGEVSHGTTKCGPPVGGDPRKIAGVAREKEVLSRALSKVALGSFISHLLTSPYLKSQEMQKTLPGRPKVLKPKYVTMKAKVPEISLRPDSHRHGLPNHRERPRGNENILEQMLQYKKTDRLLNVIYPHKATLPHIHRHSKLNEETLSHIGSNQEKSLLDEEGKCSDFINIGSNFKRSLATKLQDGVKGDEEADQKSLNLRVNSDLKKKLKTEKELPQPTPSAEILTRPVCSDPTDLAEVENTKGCLMVENNFKDSVGMGMTPLTSSKQLWTLNQTRKGELECSRSDTEKTSCSSLSTKVDLPEQELDSFSETSDYCMPALPCSKMMTKKVQFLLTECNKGAKSIEEKPTHLPKFSTLAGKNSELNLKTRYEKVNQVNEPVYEFLNLLFSPGPSRLQGDSDGSHHIPLQQGGQVDEGKPGYVDFFLQGDAINDREEKVCAGEEEGEKPGSEAAPHGPPDIQLNINSELENDPNTAEPEPGSLAWKLPNKKHDVQDHTQWTQNALESVLVTPRAPTGPQATKTENHLLVSKNIKIPLPIPGNDVSFDKGLNPAMENGSPAGEKPERNLSFNFLPRNPELSNDLQVSLLQSPANDLKYNQKINILKLTRKKMFLRPEYRTLRALTSYMPECSGSKELPGNFKRKSRNLERREKIANVFSDIIHSEAPVLFNIRMNSKFSLETNRQKTDTSCDHMQQTQETSPNGERICDPDSVGRSGFSKDLEDQKQIEENKTLVTLDNRQGFLFDAYQKDHDLIKLHKEARQLQSMSIAMEQQTHLTQTILHSVSCPILYQFPLENIESQDGLLPSKSEEAQMNEIVFSSGEQHDLPSDANDPKEQAGSIQKENTTSFNLSRPALSATKRKRNFKRNSDVNILANLRCGITKVKKSSMLHVHGASTMKHRGKLRCSFESKMKVTLGINMSDTMDTLVTVTPNISIHDKIDKGEKNLSFKYIREEVSPLDQNLASYSISFQEGEEEESKKKVFNKIQQFTFQSGQRKTSDLDRSEDQGSEKILFIIEKVISQVQSVERLLVQEPETKHEIPNDICSESSKFPLLLSKKQSVGEVLIGAGKNSLPSGRSLAGEEASYDNEEREEFKRDQQITMLESSDISTLGLFESKKETLAHRTLRSEKSSRRVILKTKKAPISWIFNIPHNDYLKNLLPKTLVSQSSDFFSYVKYSGLLEELTTEKKIERLLHQRPKKIVASLDLPILSAAELKRKRYDLKHIIRRKKVNPKYILLKTKKVPISQTFNTTKRGAPSHTMQLKCNFKAMLNQGKPKLDIILDVLFSAVPISSDDQVKAETDIVEKTKSSSFLPQQEQSPNGEGTPGTDFREKKASAPEDRKEAEKHTGEVAPQNDHPFDLNKIEAKVPRSVKSGLDLKDTLLRKSEKSTCPKAMRTVLDDFSIAEIDLSAPSDRGSIRTLDAHSDVSSQLEDVDRNIKTQNVFKTDNQDTSYTASRNFIYSDPWSESSGNRVGSHFADRYKELQREKLTILIMSKSSKSKRHKKPLKFLERKDLMGVRCKVRKAKMPLFSQILTESSHLDGRKTLENNSRPMRKGMPGKQRTAHEFSFLPLTSIANKLCITLYKTLKMERDKLRVERGNYTHRELDKLCDRGALKANSTELQNRSSNTMEINGQQKKEEENTPKLSSVPHYVQHFKSGVLCGTNPGPCKLESEQSSSEGRKTWDLSCLVEKVKQEQSIRETILKSVSRYLMDFSQVERMRKHPHPQKGREAVASLKIPFPGEREPETDSVHETPEDGDSGKKLDCRTFKKETWIENELIMALKSSGFSGFHLSKPRSQPAVLSLQPLEFRDKKTMIPKHASLKAEQKLPVSQLPNITRYFTESHCKVKQQKNECARKVSLCATEREEIPPSRLVSDKLPSHMTAGDTQYKRTLHKTPDDRLTGEKAELGENSATALLGPLDCFTTVLSDSESQVSENKMMLNPIHLTMKKKEPSLSHMLNGKLASKHRKNRKSHLETSMKVMKIVKDVVDPIVKSICSALDVVDTAVQSKLHIEEVRTTNCLVEPAKIEFPVERLLCSQSSNETDPATLSITMEQKQRVDIVRARTALNAYLPSTQTPVPITLHTEMNQSSGSWDICEESSGKRSSLHKAKVGEKQCDDQVLFRTTVQCDTQPFESGADGRRDISPFKLEASSIYIVCPKDNVTPQRMDIDLAEQEGNTGIEEDLGLGAVSFSEIHLLEIRGWKKTDKSENWKRPTYPKITIPKAKESLPGTHFSNTTEFYGLLQPREVKEVTGQSICFNVWSSMTDKTSRKYIPVEHLSCTEGTGSLITGEGDQPEKCSSEALPKPVSHSTVDRLQISIPWKQVKSHVIDRSYCEYSTPLAKKARRVTDTPLGSTKSNTQRQSLRSEGQNQQQPLLVPHEDSLEHSQNVSWILQQIMSPIKEALSKVISEPRRTSRSGLFLKNQTKREYSSGMKRTAHWTPSEQIKQNTGLHLGSDSKTSNCKNVLLPEEKKSLARVQVVISLLNGSNPTQRIRKKRQSCKVYGKVQKEIDVPRIFSYSLSIQRPIFPKRKRLKYKIRQRLNQDVICFRRRILKLKGTELLHLFHYTDPGTHKHRLDLQWNITEETVNMEHRKVKPDFIGANVCNFIHSSPHLKSNQETVDEIISNNEGETQKHLLVKKKGRVREFNIGGVKNIKAILKTGKLSVSQHNGKHLPMLLNTIKQEGTRQGGEYPPGVKPTNMCPSFPLLSYSNLNSRIPEGEKSGIPKICLPPLTLQAFGSTRPTASVESTNRGDLGNGIKSRHYFPHGKMENIPKMNDIMGLKCIVFKGNRTPFKHLLFGKEPQRNNKEKNKLMQKDKNNLDIWHKPHTYISSPYMEWDPAIKEVHVQEIMRSSHPTVTLQDVVLATMGIREKPTNNIVSRMKKEDHVSQKDERTVEKTSEEISPLDRIAKETMSPITQGSELIKEKEKKMLRNPNKVEVMEETCASTSFPYYTEVDRRTNEEVIIVNTISSFLCPKLQYELKAPKITFLKPISDDRSTSVQNTNKHIILEYEREKIPKSILGKKKTTATSRESQLAFQVQEKRKEKIKSEASVVLSNSTFVPTPSHVESYTQTRKSDFLIDLARSPLPKPSERKSFTAVKKTSNKSTQARIVDHVREVKSCQLQEEENINIQAEEDIEYTKDKGSKALLQHKPLKLQEHGRGDSTSGKYTRNSGKSKDEEEVTLTTQSSDSLESDHELDLREDDVQGITGCGISQTWLQTSFDAGRTLHAKSNGDDISEGVKRTQQHKPENGDDGGEDTVAMSYLMYSNGVISKASTFSLPQVLATSGHCGTQVTEQTKIKDQLGYSQERRMEPDEVLNEAFLPQIKTTNKDRGPIGYLQPSWHRGTVADQLANTVSALDDVPGCSHKVKTITQKETDKVCILDKDQMDFRYPGKKTSLVSILAKVLQANSVKGEVLYSRRKGVFQNKCCSVLTSSTHLQFTLKEESASGTGMLMPPLDNKGPFSSGKMLEPVDKSAKEGESHHPEKGGARREASTSHGLSKSIDLQEKASPLLPEYDVSAQGPLSRRNRCEVGAEENAKLEKHIASDGSDMTLTKPCASQHRSNTRIEGDQDPLANTGFISQLQFHMLPSSGKIRNSDSPGGIDLCFSMRKTGHSVLHEKAEERVKTGEKERLFTQALTWRAETCPLGHLPSKKMSSLNDAWERREGQEGQGKPQVVQKGSFAPFPAHSFLKGNMGRRRKKDPLDRTKCSSPPFKRQEVGKSDNKVCTKSLVDCGLMNKMNKTEKMAHKCMDPKAKKSSRTRRLNSRKMQWKIKELERMVQENKNDLVVDLKNICSTLVTLPHVELGNSEEEGYIIRITKYLQPPHLRIVEFSDVAKIAHLGTMHEEPCSSLKEFKESTLQKCSQARKENVAMNTMMDSKEMCLKTKKALMLLRSSQSNFQKTEEQEKKIPEGQWEVSDARWTSLYAPKPPSLPVKVNAVNMGESIEIVTRFSVATVKVKESLDSKEPMHIVPMSIDILIHPQTGAQDLALEEPGERTELGPLLCSKHQEEKIRESGAKTGEVLTESSLSAFSISTRDLDNKRQEDSTLVHTKTAMQRISSVKERPPTEPISPSSLKDVQTEEEQKAQERKSSQERTAEESGKMLFAQMAWKSRTSQHPSVRHRTEMHLNIGGREQRSCEDENQSCNKMQRKIYVSQPPLKNLNLDKSTQIDAGMLGIQRPSVQPIVLLTLSSKEKTQAAEEKGDGGRKNEPCKFQKEKHEVNLRIKMQPNFPRGLPISQILDSKEFVLNIIEQKKNFPGDRDDQCVALTRTLISTPTEPTFYLDPGNRTDEEVPAKTRVYPPRYMLQKSPATQKRATGKSVERDGNMVFKKAQHPQTRQEASGPGVSHFTISMQGKSLPQVKPEGKLNHLALNPEGLSFTGCGTIRSEESIEHFGIIPKPKDPSEAYKTPASTVLLSYPTRKPVTTENWKKELEIKGTFNQKINPKLLFSSIRKMPLEICITCDTPASAKGFSPLEDEAQDPLFKASTGSAKSCQHDETKKDLQNYYQVNKMIHPWTGGSLDKTSITGSNIPSNMDNHVTTPIRRGLPHERDAKTTLGSGLYLKFPLQHGKQMTLSTMTVDMGIAGYPRCQKLSGTHTAITEFDAHRRNDQLIRLVPGLKQFILQSLQTSLCPCWSLPLDPAYLEEGNERKKGENFRKDRSNTTKQKALPGKAPSRLIPQKERKKEPKIPNARQTIQPQKPSTKHGFVNHSQYPTIPHSPNCNDQEGRLTIVPMKRESTPQCLTMKIRNHPILQLLGNVEELEFHSIEPKEITLWDENGTEMYLGNLYLSRVLVPKAEEATPVERHQEREKESCSLEPQKSQGISHTVWSVWSTGDHKLLNMLPGASQPLKVQLQDAHNGPGVTSRADCSRWGGEVLPAVHKEDGAVLGHGASRLYKDPKCLVLQQEEAAATKASPADTVPLSTCEEPKEAMETQVTHGHFSPAGAAETQCGTQSSHTLLKPQGQSSSRQDTQPQKPSAGAMALPFLHVEREARTLVGWGRQEDNSLRIIQSIINSLESHTTKTIQDGVLPHPKARDTCQASAWKPRSWTGPPNTISPSEARSQAQSISERFTPEGEMNLQRHLECKTREICLSSIPGIVMQSRKQHALGSKEEAASPGVQGGSIPQHRRVCCLSVNGTDTIELNLTHQGPRGTAPGSPLKNLIIHFSDRNSQAVRWPGVTWRGSGARALAASAVESSWPPVLQMCPIEHRDKLLIHFARKTLEFQVKSFPSIVKASHSAACTQERKPAWSCIHPEAPDRTLLLFDEQSLHQIDLDLQYKYFRFLLRFPVPRSIPKPKALPRHSLKLNTAVPCKNVHQQQAPGGGLPPDREQAEKPFSFKNSNLQNSLWIRKSLKSLLGAASGPGRSRREQRDTAGLPAEKDRHGGVWFQESAPSLCPRPQKNAADVIKFQSLQPPEVFSSPKTVPKTVALEQSLSPNIQSSEESVVLEANSHLGEESKSILHKVQNGIPLEKAKIKKIKMETKALDRDTLGPGQIWVCRHHSLAITPPHPESHQGRKHRPSSQRHPSGWAPDLSLTPREPSRKSPLSCPKEKRVRTTRNKTSCSLVPLTESNLKLHLARSQGRPPWSYESKDRKKAKTDLLKKHHGHQDHSHGRPRSPGERRRKKTGGYCESGAPHHCSRRHKSARKSHPRTAHICCESSRHPPFVYACIPADSLQIIPQTVRWTIPLHTLRKNNFRAPMVAKISRTLWGHPRNVLESFLDPSHVVPPD